ncbi:MAG: hypothetical protein ACJ72L_12795 [Marmoricola sp.]
MKPSRWAALLGALVLVLCSFAYSPAGAADQSGVDWFTATLTDTGPKPQPPVVATRLTTFDAATAVHQLVSAADWKHRKPGHRVIVPSQQSTIVVRAVGCQRVTITVEEVALTGPVGRVVEVLGRVGPKNAVQSGASFGFIPDKDGGYHLVGGLDNFPQNHQVQIVHLTGDTYRLNDIDPSTVKDGPQPRLASTSTCAATLPNTGITAPRTLGPIGLGLVVLGCLLIWVSRRPEQT